MEKSIPNVKGYTPHDIKLLFRNDEKLVIGLRLYAVYQVSLGKSLEELESLYNVNHSQIQTWVRRFEKEGIEGLRRKNSRPSLLNKEQLMFLAKVLNNDSPAKYGYDGQNWNIPFIKHFIEKECGVEYKEITLYGILKKIGYNIRKSNWINKAVQNDIQVNIRTEENLVSG